MNAFENLVAPIGSRDFAANFWCQSATPLKPDPALLSLLFDDADLLDPSNLSSAGHNLFRILRARGDPIRNGMGSEAMEVWRQESQATLVAEFTQLTLKSVWSYCTSLMKTIGVPMRWTWPNVYYSRRGSGFIRHWDNHENFIVGLKGTKRFIVAPNGCITYPLQFADNYGPHIKGLENIIEAERTAETLPGMYEVDVAPGDCIFIPRGWWHEAVSLDDESVTLTWAVWTCTWGDLLESGSIDPPAGTTDLALRTPLPLDTRLVPEELGLPPSSHKELAIIRAQLELRSIANVIKDWQAGLQQQRSKSTEFRSAQPLQNQ